MNKFWGRVLLIAVLLAVPMSMLAQEEPQLWTLATVQVDNDMTQEFEELQKELSAAYKKMGGVTRLISQTVRGPSSEYLIFSPVENWAAYDDDESMAKALGEAGAARWVARVTKCIKGRRVDTLRSRPDLSIEETEGREPTLAVMTTRRNLGGKYREYDDWLVNKWTPALKQAGVNGHFVLRNAFGGNSREWMTISLIDSWASFDQPHPVMRSLGEEKFIELISGAGELTTASTRKILRLRPDLGVTADSSS